MNSHSAGRLQELRDQIEQGTYFIDAAAVAEALITRLAGEDPTPEPVAPTRTACRPSRARITAARPVGLTRRVRDVLVAVGA
jgi:hypothetical protein